MGLVELFRKILGTDSRSKELEEEYRLNLASLDEANEMLDQLKSKLDSVTTTTSKNGDVLSRTLSDIQTNIPERARTLLAKSGVANVRRKTTQGT